MAISLSPSDITLLKLLQDGEVEARAELAEKAGMSPSTLWRRMNELEAEGLIRKRVTLLDPVKLGLPVCVFVFVNLVDYTPVTRQQFDSFVERTAEIMECYSVTGAHDYTLIVRCQSVSDFERFLIDRILGHSAIKSATSQISLRQQKYTTALPLD